MIRALGLFLFDWRNRSRLFAGGGFLSSGDERGGGVVRGACERVERVLKTPTKRMEKRERGRNRKPKENPKHVVTVNTYMRIRVYRVVRRTGRLVDGVSVRDAGSAGCFQ